ncbi:MAG: hypothetical protein JST16_05295 [Bdellovibrionales bacterium]|nr:hypothetical protein [Bdellovibrionales bacterium]
MFTNTAYEAMYQYLGLSLHSAFIEAITGQKVFAGIVLLTFGVCFFLTTVQFFSRYLPGSLVRKRFVPLSKYVQIVACLFLGSALLKVGSEVQVKSYRGESWHTNPYVKAHINEGQPSYRVSLVFDVLSRSAEEVSALIARIVDGLFKSTNSQLEAPDFFFKAIMYAGASTIDDPSLKKEITFYTEECFDRLLPLVKQADARGRLDGFYGRSPIIDERLREIVIDDKVPPPVTCLDVRQEMEGKLRSYAVAKGARLSHQAEAGKSSVRDLVNWENLVASRAIANHYLDSNEGWMGMQKEAELPTTGGRVFQRVFRLVSWNGLFSVLGLKDMQGAALAASRSLEFSELLARAPHIAGFIKMAAIAVFPWLLFFVVAGYWRALVYWFLVYFSVLLWTPIWTLLYHIVVSITLSAETMHAFGLLNDGISLTASELVTSRIYHLYEVYSWLQVLTGTLFTGGLLFFMRPILSDTTADEVPDAVDDSKKTASTGMAAHGLAKKALAAAV